MNKKLLTLGLFAVIAIFLLLGCEKSSNTDSPEGLVHWNISKVEGPTSGLVNETISLDVYCPTSSGCDYISEFVSDKSGNNIDIKAFGNTLKDTNCTMAAVPLKVKYEFNPNSKGQFVLHFINRDNSVIKHHLTIQ